MEQIVLFWSKDIACQLMLWVKHSPTPTDTNTLILNSHTNTHTHTHGCPFSQYYLTHSYPHIIYDTFQATRDIYVSFLWKNYWRSCEHAIAPISFPVDWKLAVVFGTYRVIDICINSKVVFLQLKSKKCLIFGIFWPFFVTKLIFANFKMLMLVFVDLDGESNNAIPLYGPRWNNLRHKELSMILCWQYFAFGSSGMQLQKNMQIVRQHLIFVIDLSK